MWADSISMRRKGVRSRAIDRTEGKSASSSAIDRLRSAGTGKASELPIADTSTGAIRCRTAPSISPMSTR